MRLAPRLWPNGDEMTRENSRLALDPFDLWPEEVDYTELRDAAQARLEASKYPGEILQSLKLLIYVQTRAYRELGAIV